MEVITVLFTKRQESAIFDIPQVCLCYLCIIQHLNVGGGMVIMVANASWRPPAKSQAVSRVLEKCEIFMARIVLTASATGEFLKESGEDRGDLIRKIVWKMTWDQTDFL